MKTHLLLIGLLLLTSACGFHLRGSQMTNFDVSNIFVQPAGATKLATEVKSQLSGAGVSIANSAETATYIVTLREERFVREVLSVAADTGKVEEFQIVYTAKMDVFSPDGKTIVKNDNVRSVRDFTFDEDAVLGKFSEEALLQEDIVRRAASQVLRRLQALLSSNN
ncbi:MAG: LPS assembly lipoprotein LptE [Pseudomonadota bacterium]